MNETVLVVDDEETVRDVVRQHLESDGYRVLLAKDGPEALTLSRDHQGPIHLLLADVLLPGMIGSTVAARLALSRPDTKVLYISGYNPGRGAHYSVLDPGTAFLPKPFTRDSLLLTIRTVLDATETDGDGP